MAHLQSISISCSSLPPQLDEDNIDWGEPIIEELFEGTELNRSLFDVEVTCWGGGNRELMSEVDLAAASVVLHGHLHSSTPSWWRAWRLLLLPRLLCCFRHV